MKRSGAAIGVAMFAACLALAGCGDPDPEYANTDPKAGKVWLNADGTKKDPSDWSGWGYYKICDGTTLLYNMSGDRSVVPNSAECAPPT